MSNFYYGNYLSSNGKTSCDVGRPCGRGMGCVTGYCFALDAIEGEVDELRSLVSQAKALRQHSKVDNGEFLTHKIQETLRQINKLRRVVEQIITDPPTRIPQPSPYYTYSPPPGRSSIPRFQRY